MAARKGEGGHIKRNQEAASGSASVRTKRREKERNRVCKSRARKRGWGQLGARSPYSPC